MTPRQWIKGRSPEEIQKLAQKAGTSPGNIKTICYGGNVGKVMAEELCKASGGIMSEMEILYPERFEE